MRLKTWTTRVAFASIAALCLGCGGLAVAYRSATSDLSPLALDSANDVSVSVLDRNGNLLRAFTSPEGRWRLPVSPEDVDQRYLAMLMAFEDQNFYEHGGVDPKALVRAALQLVMNGRIISGASTLTMQTARLLEGKHERTADGKLRQISRALELESKLDKRSILQLYLRLAPFGGNIEGVRAASLAYFGKEPRRLSVGEAALLVALPQSPEVRRPDRNPQAAERARNRVLDRAVKAGVISAAEARRAKDEHVPLARIQFPKLAAHLAESEVRVDQKRTTHRLTIDRRLQRTLEDLAGKHVAILGQKLSAAVLVADHTTGEVLAHVGSANYLDSSRQGAIDMVTAVRSPGSTLKPIIYGLGFESGLVHPETLIEDRPVRFGNYAPKNFDDDFHGTVSIRESLAQSLNIPAVRVLARVGAGRLAGRLRRAGIVAQLPGEGEATLAMALGGVGLTLHDLAQAYSALARGGDTITLTHRQEDRARVAAAARVKGLVQARRLLSPVASWYVTDILKDAPPPINSKGGMLAYKTGTSYGYRDAWAVGYDGKYTVAVWVGRPDGVSVPGLLGRTAAAPLLFEAFQRISEKREPLPSAPRGAITAANADLPPPLKRWREPGDDTSAPSIFSEPPVVISFPLDRSELAADDLAGEPVIVKAAGGALPFTWLVDGAPVTSDPHKREFEWSPSGRGFTKFTVIDANGRVDRVSIRIN